MTRLSSPVPFDGETIFSLLARFYLRSSFRSAHTVARKLGLSGQSFLASPLGSGFLGTMFEVFPELNAVLDLETVVERHTITPLLMAFSQGCNNRERRAEIVRAIGEHGGWRGAPRSSLMICPNGLRFCSECCAQDFDELGVPYWHREHQVKFVTRCWRHDSRLNELRRGVGVDYRLDVPPISSSQDGFAEVSIPEPVGEQVGMKLALATSAILDAPRWNEPGQIRWMFLEAAGARDLLHHGRPSAKRIWNFVEEAYGKAFLAAMGFPSKYSVGVARRYVVPFREGRVRLDPAVVILIAVALDIAPDRLSCGPVGRSKSSVAAGGPCPISYATQAGNSELERVLADNQYILNRAAGTLGISRPRLVRRIIDAGITCPVVQGSNAKFSESQIHEMMDLLRGGLPREHVEERYSCTSSFLDQIAVYDSSLREDARQARRERLKERHREAVSGFIKVSSDVTREMLREKLSGSVSFLERHDKTWLGIVLNGIPKRPAGIRGPRAGRGRVNDDDFDLSTLARLKGVKEQALELTPPRRLTISLMFRLAGVPSKAFARLSAARMPQTEGFLKGCVETKADFTHRKLRYAFGKLAASRQTVTATSLRLVSGFTPERLRQHRGYIRQLAEESGMPFSTRAATWVVLSD